MHLRLIPIVVVSMALAACGGEGVSTPPEHPVTTVETNPASTADEKTSENKTSSANELKAGAEQPKSDNATPQKPADSAVSDKGVTMEKPADKPTESDVPGANITIGKMDADGVSATNIECKSDGGGGGLGLLGVVFVTGWISKQKQALDACAPGGSATETRIIWTAKDGKMVSIAAKGDAKVKACVEKALRPGKPAFDGKCAATVAYGKK